MAVVSIFFLFEVCQYVLLMLQKSIVKMVLTGKKSLNIITLLLSYRIVVTAPWTVDLKRTILSLFIH